MVVKTKIVFKNPNDERDVWKLYLDGHPPVQRNWKWNLIRKAI